MARLRMCKHCGVPLGFSRENSWGSDGSITQTSNPDHRVIFYEAEGMNRLLDNIAGLLGVPIDHIVIEGKRKSTYNYLQGMFSGIKLAVVKAFLRRRVYETISARGGLLGYGHYELVDFKPGRYIEVKGTNVYSLTLFSADMGAVFNLVEGRPAQITWEDRGENELLIRVVPGQEADAEMAARLARVVLPRKPGNITFERCPSCGIPIDFKGFTWEPDRGTITDNATGRRMAILGAEGVEAVFRELESELGEELSRTIVEAQRRYVVDTLQMAEVRRDPSYLTHQLALRGMGNVVRFELSRDRLEAVVENAIPPLLVAGMMQGIFELLTGKGSSCSYERDGAGSLRLTVESA